MKVTNYIAFALCASLWAATPAQSTSADALFNDIMDHTLTGTVEIETSLFVELILHALRSKSDQSALYELMYKIQDNQIFYPWKPASEPVILIEPTTIKITAHDLQHSLLPYVTWTIYESYPAQYRIRLNEKNVPILFLNTKNGILLKSTTEVGNLNHNIQELYKYFDIKAL